MAIAQHHADEVLAPRGISAEQAEGFGVRSILTGDELPPEFHDHRYAKIPGLLFTWNSPLSGEVHQLRPDEPVLNPKQDPVKYVFGKGVEMVLNRLRDPGPDSPVLLNEGTMQSIAAAIYAPEGWAVYGMSGCWNWRNGDTQVATPDLMVVEGRDVTVALDADAQTNLNVYNAGMALKDALENEGATSVRFLRLDGHGKKAGLDDVLGARPEPSRASYLARLLERAEEKPAKTKPPKSKSTASTPQYQPTADRPLIQVNDDRQAVINQLTEALRVKWDGRELFSYGGVLAKRDDVTITPVTKGMFADLVAEAALTVTISSKGDAMPAWPDEKSCDATLSRSARFSRLDRISRVPFVRPDGTICQTPGYDETTATFLVLDESISGIQVPDEPSAEEVQWAVKLLTEEWLGDLFDIMPEPEDRANCLGLVLTTLVRGLVPLAPLAVVDGLQMGVGKNLLADLVSIFATGAPASPLLYNREDEENRKVITAEFRAGRELLVFDEAHVIEGRAMAKSITGITYTDRILGVSSMIEFPNRVTWMALGNNVSVNGDLARRVYRIRLAPKVANPQDRDVSNYRHPDIKRWTRENRNDLIAAALTLIRSWFAGERAESAAGRRFGSFEAWGGMVGGILDNAGVEGFLGSLVEWRSETDYETSYWAGHLTWLRDTFKGSDFTVADVVRAMKQKPQNVEHPPRLEDHNQTGYNRLLGLSYRRVRNRIIAGLQLVKTHEAVGHGARWAVLDTRDTPMEPEAKAADTPTDSASYANNSPATCRKNDGHSVRTACMTNVSRGAPEEAVSDTSLTSAHVAAYPTYPHYPPTEGADPLDFLVHLAVPQPARTCPDCDSEEELVPGAHWFACRVCTPNTFLSRSQV